MANYTYTSDIVLDALFRAGEPADSTSDFYTQSFVYLNNLYMQLCRGGSELVPTIHEDWSWLRKPSPGVLIIEPPITTGTASVTLGSTSVTLSTTPTNYAGSNLSVATWYFRVTGHPDVFKVASHTSGTTSVTLDAAYTGTTNTAASYTLFRTDYNLATDVLRLVAPMRVYRNAGWGARDDYKIYMCDLDALEEGYPTALIDQGVPDYFAMVGETTQGTKRIRFNRCGGGASATTTVYRVEYEYLVVPTALTSPGTAEVPLVPYEWRHVLADFLLAYLFGVKNDDRTAGVVQAAQQGLQGMARENRYKTVTATRDLFRLKPRLGTGRGLAPKRTEQGHLITG